MDATASPRVDADVNEVYGFFLKIEDSSYSSPLKHKNTVIKYTKLPDLDFDSRVPWPEKSYTVQPRLRRIIALDDPDMITSRSLKSELVAPLKTMSSITRRKIVTIAEDDESDLHPKFSKDVKRSSKTSNKAVEADSKNERPLSQRTTSRLTNSSKYSREIKPSAKTSNPSNRKDVTTPKSNYKAKYSNISQPSPDNTKMRNLKEKDIVRTRSSNASSKISLSKNLMSPRESEKEVSVIKSKLFDSLKSTTPHKKSIERPRSTKPTTQSHKTSSTILKEIHSTKSKPVTIIHVPLEEKYIKENSKDSVSDKSPALSVIDSCPKKESSTVVETEKHSKDVSIGTDPIPVTFDKVTQKDYICEATLKSIENANVQTNMMKETFDSLDIPNVTLTKDRNESKEESVKLYSKSLPNLNIPALDITQQKGGSSNAGSNFCNSASYIIGHATVTCTTKQKINFHVVGSNNETSSNHSPSPLAYPVNVVSIYEKEIKKKQLRDAYEQEDKSHLKYTNCLNELKSLNCSYIFNSTKLVKPSDIISTIRVNNGLLQSDYICEQFERELNFIDSFFESLQYLESSSLSDKCFTENKVKTWVNSTDFDVRNSEYGCFLSKLENGANVDDSETMASKSLCLLNLLIRDEQRRAKNLLFVLKMREDALKDFTKSQILWLENKKKQDNTDISTLKKKQRGALLKLQHECGEMQRMRKALLTQSEKRKVVLLKTKKNIELKLKNSVDVDQIILGKKKLKRNLSDRNTTPLKCFDLSSSGCEESSTSRPKSEAPPPEALPVTAVASAEKCIQTGESVLGSAQVNQSTDTAAENFVVVDGGFLNILFHNLSMPQIFSNGKQYEVNEEALRNIVNSANSNNNLNESDVLDKFMNQIKNPELESSSPSTARSLVEELDQYYKGFIEEDKIPESPVLSICEVKDMYVQPADPVESKCFESTSTMVSESTETVADDADVLEEDCLCDAPVEVKGEESCSPLAQAGPLPVPAGASAPSPEPPSQATDAVLWKIPTSTQSPNSNSDCSSNSSLCQSGASLSSLTSPVCEAEELRRQQLAIEQEIKALEQQQSQLLVVREIPDKPPPPYTPPAEVRTPKLPRMYVADETTEEKIQRYIRDPQSEHHDPADAFDSFVRDFCIETLERQTLDRSDKPWDSCNLLPQKPPDDTEKVIKKTSSHLLEILTGVSPPVVSGVSGRRSDHIDDILFAEWRRCEPEWTALHTDEAIVKNQIFESIFQKILTETVDEYKRTVMCDN